MVIKVLSAFSNDIFSKGIARLLEDEKDLELAADFPEAGPLTAFEPDIVLTDIAALSTFSDSCTDRKYGLILLDTGCGRDELISAIVDRNVSGILFSNATPAILKKAIRSVASGGVWIDASTVKDLVYGINALKRGVEVLSEKEKEVTALISKGLKNRDVAARLGISELTVKAHLHRIFKKLDIKTRSQLVSYSIRNSAARRMLSTAKKHP